MFQQTTKNIRLFVINTLRVDTCEDFHEMHARLGGLKA